MTEIDGGEGKAESRLCSVRKEDNSSVSRAERGDREKDQQVSWILNMTKYWVYEPLEGTFCAVLKIVE